MFRWEPEWRYRHRHGYSDSALLVPTWTRLNSDNALLALNRQYVMFSFSWWHWTFHLVLVEMKLFDDRDVALVFYITMLEILLEMIDVLVKFDKLRNLYLIWFEWLWHNKSIPSHLMEVEINPKIFSWTKVWSIVMTILYDVYVHHTSHATKRPNKMICQNVWNVIHILSYGYHDP